MPETPDSDRIWKIVKLAEPVEGLAELYEHDRARYADATAERILGPVGRMVAFSKTSYSRANPTNVPVFNANVCTEARGKIWFGDLDLTIDEPQLLELARALGERTYVLYERAARFGNENNPALEEFIAAFAPNGTVVLDRWTVRASDGRLRPRGSDG